MGSNIFDKIKRFIVKEYYHVEDHAKQYGTLRLRYYVWVLIFAAVFFAGWWLGRP